VNFLAPASGSKRNEYLPDEEGTLATVIAGPGPSSTKRHPFAPRHAWDRYFFLTYVAIIWVGILAGFVPEIVRHVASNDRAFPIIIHVHGVTFVSWLILLTVQALLIRNHRLKLHRALGVAGPFLAGTMIIVGLVTSLTMDRIELPTPQGDPQFLSIQLLDLTEFGILAFAAYAARNLPSAHKRLILLATLSIADAGFARWLGPSLHFGEGVLSSYVELFLPTSLLVIGIGAYDLVTRRRLHPAYVAGATLIIASQFTASWLYHNAAWTGLATSVVKAWPFT
jgi:hypothetical protein